MDIIHKLKIVEKELDETIFWLEFIIELIPSLKEDIDPIMKQSQELIAIRVASIKTVRNNK
ncbi:MAG: four helix bundle protein [Saprospiraceae bacterium]